MEEVDGIIIHTLKSIGCDIEEDVQSLHQFTTELTVEATARCIKTINNDIDVPHKLAPSMSARFRVGTSLAKALQDLGYRGEVGYQTFLYSNDADLRKVFIFLVEKLPKDSSDAQDEVLGTSTLLQRAIGDAIRRRLSSPWTPPFCKQRGVCWRGQPAHWQREGISGMNHFQACPLTCPRGLQDVTRKIPKEVRTYYSNVLPLIDQQPSKSHQVAASVLEMNARQVTAQQEWETEWNQQGLASRLTKQEYKSHKRQKIDQRLSDQMRQAVKHATSAMEKGQDLSQLINTMEGKATSAPKVKGSRFTHAEKLQFTQDDDKVAAQAGVGEGPRVDTEEEQQQRREMELNELKEDLISLNSKLEDLQINIRKTKAGIQQNDEEVQKFSAENKQRDESCRIKRKTLDLLPDAENNIAKLQEVVEGSAQRLVKLANQWEKHRAPLVNKFRELKELSEVKQSDVEKKLEEIQELRERMKEAAADTRNKDELLKQLRAEYENITKDVNRSAYTKRILEIVSNIKKQKKQIDQVLLDTKTLQKEINQLSGKLDRTFTVTDELIFKDAKKDDSVRKAYKHLAALHQNCSSVIQTVEETGVILREIRDLEDQVEQESKKKILDNLEKITSDYQSMKKENNTLVAKIKKQTS